MDIFQMCSVALVASYKSYATDCINVISLSVYRSAQTKKIMSP